MTAPEPLATRREVDQLRAELTRLDDHGSRGVGAIQLQLTELVKDITEVRNDVANVKTDVGARFDAHHQEHQQAARDQRQGRRWLIGIGLTAVLAMCALVTMVADLLLHSGH